MNMIFDRLTSTLEHSLDFRLERGNMISANLANVDTPGYTPVELTFDQQLADFLGGRNPPQVQRTDINHLGATSTTPRGEAEYDFFALPDADGNAVDLDHEMAKMTENQLLYKTTTKIYSKRMALIKYAIAEGN
jgi:flagellar basal-body rod protein FlgB